MSDWMIDRVLDQTRQNADETSINAKYSDDDLLSRIEAAFQHILFEIGLNRSDPVLVRHNIEISQGTDVYLLPPNVGRVQRFARLNDDREIQEYWEPRSPRNIYGPGFRFEGRLLRFEPSYIGDSKTLELLYIPNGDFRLHYGTAMAASASTVTLPAAPTKGSLDTRENAYVGGVLRLTDTGNGYLQERVITAYDRVTRIAAVEPDFSPAPSGTITYEIVPCWLRAVERIAALFVAVELAAITGNLKKRAALEMQYRQALRVVRQSLTQKQNIIGQYFEHDTWPAQRGGYA